MHVCVASGTTAGPTQRGVYDNATRCASACATAPALRQPNQSFLCLLGMPSVLHAASPQVLSCAHSTRPRARTTALAGVLRRHCTLAACALRFMRAPAA